MCARAGATGRRQRRAAAAGNTPRVGPYESPYGPEVPTKVAINGALELAKRYSTAQSSRFVNGILDRLQPAAPEAPAPEAEPEISVDPSSGETGSVSE